MENYNLNDLVQTIKSCGNVEIIKEVAQEDGIYRNYIFEVNNYTITLEYLDFGRVCNLLNFFIQREGQAIKVLSISHGLSLLGISPRETVNSQKNRNNVFTETLKKIPTFGYILNIFANFPGKGEF